MSPTNRHYDLFSEISFCFLKDALIYCSELPEETEDILAKLGVFGMC